VFIAVVGEVAASAKSSNIEITLYSDNCGGKETKFITSANLHVVTNLQYVL
jgi:hypothetical protein